MGTRTSIACEGCRKGKRKCDGQKPECCECRRHSRQCIYLKRDPKKQRSHTSNKEYVNQLEQQVKSLSALVEAMKLSLEDHECLLAENTSSNAGKQLNLEGKTTDFDPTPESIPSSTPALQDLSALMWRKTLDSDQEMFIGPGSFFNLTKSRPINQRDDAAATYMNELSCESIAGPLFHSSQDTTLYEHFVDQFLKYVNPYHQFVDSKTLPRPLNYLHAPPDKQNLALSIIAIGACFSDHPNAIPMSAALAAHAEHSILSCYQSCPSIWLTRSLSILALRALIIGADSAAWMHLTLAASLIVQMGIHVTGAQSLVVHGSLTRNWTLDLETFWSFYFVDRLSMAITGRRGVSPNHQVHVPSLETAFGPQLDPERLLWDRFCQLWYIHDYHMENIAVFEFNTMSNRKKDSHLMSARAALLNFHTRNYKVLTLAENGQTPASELVFQISYQVAQLAIHRPFLYNAAARTTRLALEATTTAANMISRIVRVYRKRYSFSNAPPFMIYHLLRTAMSHLLVVSIAGDTMRKQKFLPLDVILVSLEEMKLRYVRRVDQAIWVIREVAAKWGVTWALPMHLSQPVC